MHKYARKCKYAGTYIYIFIYIYTIYSREYIFTNTHIFASQKDGRRRCVNKSPLQFLYKLKPFYVNICVRIVGGKVVCKNT